MTLFTLSPAVPADNARKTWDDATAHRTLVGAVFSLVAPVTTELFDSGLGGLLGVTEPLAAALAATDFTGYRLVPATGEPSEYAEDAASITIPSPLYALEIHGKPGVDDFAQTYRLVFSKRTADFLCARDPALSGTREEVDESGRMVRRSVSE
ncbi:hypothetical protein [Nocardia otitidiscaviarum]|uniref:hypothetical protein n=1 Tax=Nocardia otitidiscaviarum TaxID=1823 RepID=UPI002458F74F|nr:hypothetical protein [Nocardia otitidiscaviarum]